MAFRRGTTGADRASIHVDAAFATVVTEGLPDSCGLPPGFDNIERSLTLLASKSTKQKVKLFMLIRSSDGTLKLSLPF